MKWFCLLPCWLVFNIVAMIGALVLPFFAVARYGPCDNNSAMGTEPRLPLWLSWFETPDNSLLGDGAWQRMEPGHWPWRAKFSGFFQFYLGALGWLWRNSAYGFQRKVLGAKIAPADTVTFKGDPSIQDKPNGKEGFCFTRIGSYWNLNWVKRFGSRSRCIKLNLGWKLKTYAEDPARIATQPTAQYTVSPRITTFLKA